jgi:hypothetical protein
MKPSPLYKEKKKSESDKYDFGEFPLNALGYAYFKTNLPAALAILKLNTEQYPNSSNVYESYGEALLKAAIENYRKSVEIDPGNISGIAALKKMGVSIDNKEVVVPEATLETYVGAYELQPGFIITVSREGHQLFAQATGQPKFEVFPKSNTEFFLKVVEAQITFTVTDGKVESLTLHQGGQKINGKKIK